MVFLLLIILINIVFGIDDDLSLINKYYFISFELFKEKR